MMNAVRDRTKRRPTSAERRTGYVVAIIVEAAMVYVANDLLEWEWPSFLTEDFGDVLPWLSASLIASIVIRVGYLVDDPRWVRSLGQLVENVFSVIVTVSLLRVFPFDFSAWDRDWSWLIRTILWIALIGVAIGSVVELVRLARGSSDTEESTHVVVC